MEVGGFLMVILVFLSVDHYYNSSFCFVLHW